MILAAEQMVTRCGEKSSVSALHRFQQAHNKSIFVQQGDRAHIFATSELSVFPDSSAHTPTQTTSLCRAVTRFLLDDYPAERVHTPSRIGANGSFAIYSSPGRDAVSE